VNEAITSGGESYFRYRQIEMLPQVAPVIADALGRARMVTISGGGADGHGSAASDTTNSISQVIQTVLAAQLVTKSGMMQADQDDTRVQVGKVVAGD
jgi:flotillin